ncbi:DUF2235 domain-containing protein [Shewanella sp. GXUN23E]|uniref:DUF2235 domain-containing protein n=1 Tax=Shewanella sp. GXUN23E TaxID=3422498 RepID=UPI003D7E3563
MRKLIVCCDGTWNNPAQEENGIPAPTNVVKLFHAIGDGADQLTYYHPGLGGEDTGVKDAILGGALGVGIERHVCSAYHWLASHYQAGDSICLFGFSRGAFTARCVAGMLSYGLLDLAGVESADGWARVSQVYRSGYRQKNRKWNQQSDYGMHHQGKACEVAFLGVWDTVGALGIPDDLELINLFDSVEDWGFHDYHLGHNVKVARHAMALDEMRSSFTVARWDGLDNHGGDVKERWFPGMHADVGGGYAHSDLSNRPLAWMIQEASGIIRFRDDWRALLPANAAGVMHNSFKGVFAKMRSRPRSIPLIISNGGRKPWEEIDDSVFTRQRLSPLEWPPYHPEKRLMPGMSVAVDIFADTRWNNTGLYLEPGHYQFSARGEWQDSKDSCDWRGTENNERTLGDVVRSTLSFWGKFEPLLKKITGNKKTDLYGTRRHEDIPWFRLVGVITNDLGKGDGNAVRHDGSPCPHQYFDATQYQGEQRLEVTEPGYLYAYPNDAWAMYDNNHGSVSLTVTRVD